MCFWNAKLTRKSYRTFKKISYGIINKCFVFNLSFFVVCLDWTWLFLNNFGHASSSWNSLKAKYFNGTKPTDRNKYLLPESCHLYSNIENIPVSLAIRILGISTKPGTREIRFSKLKEMLLERCYPYGIINAATNKI